jgi:hypothetical protein
MASDEVLERVFTLSIQPDGKFVVLGTKGNAMIAARYVP